MHALIIEGVYLQSVSVDSSQSVIYTKGPTENCEKLIGPNRPIGTTNYSCHGLARSQGTTYYIVAVSWFANITCNAVNFTQ